MRLLFATIALLAFIIAARASGGVMLLLGGKSGTPAPACSNSLDFSSSCNSYYIPNRS